MATAGPNSPTSVSQVEDGETGLWLNINNILLSDNVYTTAEGGLGFSNALVITNFLFDIPVGATIDGVLVEVESFADDTNCSIDSISLYNTTYIGDFKFGSSLSAVESYVPFGGPSDKWGATLTPEIVNSSTFGIILRAGYYDFPFLETGIVSVDHVKMTITYTAAGVGGSTAVTVSRNRNNGLRSNSLKNPRSFNVF